MDHGQVDKAFGNGWTLLKILVQTPKTVQPAESTLDNPALGLHLEPIRTTTEGHERLHTKEVLTPTYERRTGITAIANEQFQTLKWQQPSQKLLVCASALLISGMHQDPHTLSVLYFGVNA
jgi:hypothetical protein